jgi:hypothetical protein
MTNTQEQVKNESFRFEIFKGKIANDGSFTKLRTVGHAYLRTGKHAYKAKLFGSLSERFVIVPVDDNPEQYRILTKEEVQTKDKGKRTYWNVVGDGEVLSQQGLLKLDFDLFGKPLYMSLYPSNAGNVLPFQLADEIKGAA